MKLKFTCGECGKITIVTREANDWREPKGWGSRTVRCGKTDYFTDEDLCPACVSRQQ